MTDDLLPTLDELAHRAIEQAFEKLVLSEAGPLYAVDATAGNGYDTLFLARLLHGRGEVYAFDVQPAALAATRARLAAADLLSNVHLVQAGHELLKSRLPQQARGRVIAAMLNLGFLPGSDKSVTTRPETTLRALHALAAFSAPRAVITAHLYTGHAGGKQESEAVLTWARDLDRKTWRVLACSQQNKPRGPEHLLLIEKRG